MNITSTQVLAVCAASTLVTGLELARQEHALPASATADRASIHSGVMLQAGETALLAASAFALHRAAGSTGMLGKLASHLTPAIIGAAFTAGTAYSVLEMHKTAAAAPAGSETHRLYAAGSLGSSFETAGLGLMTIGLLGGVHGAARAGLMAGGAALVGVGWPTSLGYGPLAH